jgi:membrane associated rhomboid family serine protease
MFVVNWLVFHNRFDEILSLHYPTSHYFEPFQLVTYMFMHANFWHIFFNMLALWMFGTEIEYIWGPRRFLVYYLICGLGAAGLHFIITGYTLTHVDPETAAILRDVPMLGASGAIYGILLAYGFMFPNRQLLLLFPPIPVKAKYLVIGYGLIEFFSGVSNMSDNIAHFAHLGGMLTGLILLLIWRKQGRLY